MTQKRMPAWREPVPLAAAVFCMLAVAAVGMYGGFIIGEASAVAQLLRCTCVPPS